MKKHLLVFALLLTLAPLSQAANAADYADVFLADFDRASQKLNDLGDAVPADKFSYRPVESVRTVSEVLMHVAIANFLGAKALGVAAPEYFNPAEMEKKYTSKEDATRILKESQEAVRKALAASKADLGREVELFGAKRSGMAVFVLLAGHTHEHLGQMISYVRSAGITPPWSKKE